MMKLWRRWKRWSQQRVAHCNVCGATSDRIFGDGAERIARNHSRGTGHANVTVRRRP